jgi:hypothetical protein
LTINNIDIDATLEKAKTLLVEENESTTTGIAGGLRKPPKRGY